MKIEMKKGFMLPILIIGLAALGVFYVFTYSTSTPSEKTLQTAKNIPKYSQAKDWEIEDNKIPCVFNYGGCQNPSAKIRFSTEEVWANIYEVYKNNMPNFGWTTQSHIVTSIPTSIVFVNKEGCVSELSENTSAFVARDTTTPTHYYLITVNCKQ